jgi:hypothetical protein
VTSQKKRRVSNNFQKGVSMLLKLNTVEVEFVNEKVFIVIYKDGDKKEAPAAVALMSPAKIKKLINKLQESLF